MWEADELHVPSAADDEAKAAPVVGKLADVIGAIAAAGGFISPARLEIALSVAETIGRLLGEPSLSRVLVLRAMTAPPRLRAAFSDLKTAALPLSVAERAAIMHELSLMIHADVALAATGLLSDLAGALDVRPPSGPAHDGTSLFDALGFLRERTLRYVRSETPLLTEAREFSSDFNETQLLSAIRAGDEKALVHSLGLAVDTVRKRIAAVTRAADAQAEALSIAKELDDVADQIERVARQRYASITRRASMLKRHLREDLNALAEDAAEEFEVDFRRLAETRRSWFGKLDTSDLNERLVIKNLERRYRNLTHRYQDQLDLLSVEVSEYCEEFTQIGDDALRPMARHQFRRIAPHPSLELRVKAAIDRASTGTLMGGAAGVAASGAAVHFGLMSAAALATPVGAVLLGAVAFAGIWKAFASPGERRKRDPRERARALDDKLREAIMANLPNFDQAIDAISAHFRAVVVPDVARPRVEAERIREIASAHRMIATQVVEAANTRIERLIRASQTA
jgi:hypothetical protein